MWLWMIVLATVALASHSAFADDPASSKAAFTYVFKIATGVRCRNCHAPGEGPRQMDSHHPHNMNVKRRIDELGMQCQSCHQDRNFRKAHMPPGAPNWHMPPAKMVIRAEMSPKELCEQFKDKSRNSEHGPGRTLEELAKHADEDPLIRWTWNPGPERTPSFGTHEEFARQFRLWVETGAHCPE